MSEDGNGNNIVKTERELIFLLLHHRNVVSDFLDQKLPVDMFHEEHRFLVESIVEVYQEHDVLLTRKNFRNKVKKYNIPKERIFHEATFTACFSAHAEVDDFPLLLSKLIEYKIQVSLDIAIDDLYEEIKKSGRVRAVRTLIDKCHDILDRVNTNIQKIYYEDIRIFSKERTQYVKDVRDGKIEEEPPILTGIKEIDDTMVTGLEKGTLTLFCADVGVFKSTMMLNIALNVWKNGYNVLFVPLEMHRDQMWRRVCSREARIPSELITANIKKISDEQMERIEKMNENWKNIPSHFYMMQEPSNTTVGKIERQIERHIQIFKPHIVVIDYVANLQADKERYGRNDLEIGDMLKAMRQMGKDIGFAVVSAAQLGRDALKRLRKAGSNRDKPIINSEDIRGSHEYAADADNIYAQLKSASQPHELLDLFVVKARNGKNYFENGKVRAILEVYPDIGLIKSPSDSSDDSIDEDFNSMMDEIEIDDEIIKKDSIFDEDKVWDEVELNDVTGSDDASSDDMKEIIDNIDEGDIGDWEAEL